MDRDRQEYGTDAGFESDDSIAHQSILETSPELHSARGLDEPGAS